MPQLSEAVETAKLTMLVYGMPKTRKTWFAATAAQAGFNVLLIDGDNGWQIAKQLPVVAQANVGILDVVDLPERPVFSKLTMSILDQKPLYINEAAKTIVAKPEEASFFIDLRKATVNDVVIIDSYSAMVQSLTTQYAMANGGLNQLIDPTKDSKGNVATKTDWSGYAFLQDWSGQFFTRLQALPCNVILINHMITKDIIRNGVIAGQRIHPSGTSKAQSEKIAKYFNEIYCFMLQDDFTTKIALGNNEKRDGGSRLFEPATVYFGGNEVASSFKYPEGTKAENKGNFNFPMLLKKAGRAPLLNTPPTNAWKWLKK